MAEKALLIDQDGIFTGRKGAKSKPPLKLLQATEELRILSNLADAGLLSSAEKSGLFSTLEKKKAFSQIEKLLPLADDLKLLSLAENLLNVPSSTLTTGAAALIVGELALIAAVPDDNGLLLGLQVATGVAAGAGALTLAATGYLFGLIQENGK